MTTTATTHPPQAPTTIGRRDRVALGLLVSAQFLVMLDASIVNVALPSIQRELDFGPAAVTWVVNAYVLAFAGLLLLSGRAADLFGRRRVFVAGRVPLHGGHAARGSGGEPGAADPRPRRAGGRCRRAQPGGHVPAAGHLPRRPARQGDGGVGGGLDAGWSHRRDEPGECSPAPWAGGRCSW